MTPEPGKETGTDEAVRAVAVAWLSRLRASDSANHHKAFEAWYAADPRHADIYDDVLANWESMALAARTPAAQAIGHQTSRGPAPRRPAIAFAAVAAIILIVLTGIGLLRLGAPPTGPADSIKIASRLGEIRSVTLSDGSRVTLDTDSTLSVAYTAGERRLSLGHGRVRFDVAHDPARPFVVEADGGVIIARGTLFDVDLRGHRLTVSLLRGSVEVRKAAAGRGGQPSKGQLLRPGERLALVPQTPTGAPVPLPDTDTRWPSGVLSFENTPLAEVVAAANRYNKDQIVLADPAVGRLRFTGTFAASNPHGLARMLAATFNLERTRGDRGGIVLSSRR